MANKRAKILEKDQIVRLLKEVTKGEHRYRDEVAVRLSYYAGLRAGEIAGLRWKNNILDAVGNVSDVVHITSDVGKRAVERVIPMEPDLRKALIALRKRRPEDEYVFYALHNHIIPQIPAVDRKGLPLIDPATGEQLRKNDPDWQPGRVSANAVVQWFRRLYAHMNYEGCSSHSGRRKAITVWARNANLNGCSIRDVQLMAGHRNLETTAAYIGVSPQQGKLVSSW